MSRFIPPNVRALRRLIATNAIVLLLVVVVGVVVDCDVSPLQMVVMVVCGIVIMLDIVLFNHTGDD